ncbi:hypothetical protein PoB_000086000 [Plakobranchus ocellatus]|uniref:Uncharacterized protein n=1 Tax=Plakobranchus ocellatus TaxID=259542 RepID=A0AAV3XUL7_9GAST|nr:hypothetical protein PoB_000086000 [Plakobranchus ocellatus]
MTALATILCRYMLEQTVGDSATRKSYAMNSLEADIDYFMTEINELFASLQPKGLNIRILKKRLDALGSNINLFSAFDPSWVALKAFHDWLGRNFLSSYDAAILYTEHDFRRPGKKQWYSNEIRISVSA